MLLSEKYASQNSLMSLTESTGQNVIHKRQHGLKQRWLQSVKSVCHHNTNIMCRDSSWIQCRPWICGGLKIEWKKIFQMARLDLWTLLIMISFAEKHCGSTLSSWLIVDTLLISWLFNPFVSICRQLRFYICYLGEFVKNKTHRTNFLNAVVNSWVNQWLDRRWPTEG